MRFQWQIGWSVSYREGVVQSQSCVRLFFNPMDCSPLGSSLHGISQARILEWVATCFSRGYTWPRDWIGGLALSRGFFTTEPPWKPCALLVGMQIASLSWFAQSCQQFTHHCFHTISRNRNTHKKIVNYIWVLLWKKSLTLWAPKKHFRKPQSL